MDKKIRINIQVGEARYPLWVNMDDEPIFREAARMVNRRLIAYKTKFRGNANLAPDDFLAMAAIDLAASQLQQKPVVDTDDAASDLEQMKTDLEQFLNADE